MRVIVFGGTGMVGQGVLRECLLDPDVSEVLSIGRGSIGQNHAKLREIVQANLLDYSGMDDPLSGFDACFFCLGVSSAGMKEEAYRRVTYDIPLAAAKALVRLNPAMTFILVSGAGADNSEGGGVMWARVKGAAENAVRALPFRDVYVFRPGFIQPLYGITSRTAAYRAIYRILTPFMGAVKRLLPNQITTTERVGRAMIAIARRGYPLRILSNRDINAAAGS